MTTTKQLIEFLQKLPPDTEVQVLKEVSRGYQTATMFDPLELPAGDPLTDCTNTCDVLSIAGTGHILYLGCQ
jgi:hypothetical protein